MTEDQQRQRSTPLDGAVTRLALLVLLLIVGLSAFNIVGRFFGLGMVGANLWAAWLLPALAWLGFITLQRDLPQKGWRMPLVALAGGFTAMSLALGMSAAAMRVGGVEPVIAIPVPLRFALAAGFFGVALLRLLWCGPAPAAAAILGAGLAMVPLPPLSPWFGVSVFAVAILVRAPVAVALMAAVALAPGRLNEAAFAQSMMRGLSANVLLAVPLFILAAALVVAGGIGERIAVAARVLVGRRATALGEANTLASLLFGGVSASSIADAATGARLLSPAMVAAGYGPGRAAAICAASAVLPNVMPPSIGLLLAAAATDQSVGALWTHGAVAALVLTAFMLVAVRLTPPARDERAQAVTDANGDAEATPDGRRALLGLLPVVAVALALLGSLRFGLVTATEAGVVAVALGMVFALLRTGIARTLQTAAEAAVQSGRVLILIAAAAPVAFLVAISGLSASDVLPPTGSFLALAAAIVLCLVVGTVLDAGAAILLMLPVLVPSLAVLGVDALHATLALTIALLIGGLTPPVGILVLVVKEVTGARGVYIAVLPYLLALVLGLCAVAFGPPLVAAMVSTVGL